MPTLKRTLREKHVELIDESRMVLRCKSCGRTWSPNTQAGGRLPHGYWKCPEGCNVEA